MSEKTCKKCGHITNYSGAEPQSCSACGAVYAKVEEALRAAAEARAARNAAAASTPAHAGLAATPAAAARSGRRTVDVHGFAAQMRGDSLYPFWRKLVGLVTILGYISAIIVLIIAMIVISNGSPKIGMGVLALAAFIAIMARVGKEAALMLADLSDASVRMAARRETD